MKFNQGLGSEKGFTLTELLTTVATIGVVASLLLPVVSKVKNKAKDRQCYHNQRNLKMGMENAYTDAITDYNFRWHEGDEREFIRIFVNENIHPLIPDNSIKGLGLYMSKPLTCPYAANPGRVRAPFKIIPVNELERDSNISLDSLKGINYFSYTYGLNYYFMKNDGDTDGNNDPAVACEKEGIKQNTTLREYFHWLENHVEKKGSIDFYQPLHIDSSLMHPGKSKRGEAITYGSGKQEWVKFDYGEE